MELLVLTTAPRLVDLGKKGSFPKAGELTNTDLTN
jgi:hypothetical protein